jgi:hypothetical protein
MILIVFSVKMILYWIHMVLSYSADKYGLLDVHATGSVAESDDVELLLDVHPTESVAESDDVEVLSPIDKLSSA